MLIYWSHAALELCLTFHQLQRRERETEREITLGHQEKIHEHENEDKEFLLKIRVPLHLPPNDSKAKSII